MASGRKSARNTTTPAQSCFAGSRRRSRTPAFAIYPNSMWTPFFPPSTSSSSKSRNRRAVSSAKTKNHHRAAVRQFLQWAVRNDCLHTNHRLAEADGMRPQKGNTAQTEFYTPREFRALLEKAEGPMRAMLAIGGLAGLRTSELLRLDWSEVWRVRGHIEVTAEKAKTRQRRLVEVCPALAAWLKPFRTVKTGKLCEWHEITFQQHFVELCGRQAERQTC